MRANRLLCELVDHDSGLNANLDRFEAIVVELVAGGVAVPLRARLGHLLSGAGRCANVGNAIEAAMQNAHHHRMMNPQLAIRFVADGRKPSDVGSGHSIVTQFTRMTAAKMATKHGLDHALVVWSDLDVRAGGLVALVNRCVGEVVGDLGLRRPAR